MMFLSTFLLALVLVPLLSWKLVLWNMKYFGFCVLCTGESCYGLHDLSLGIFNLVGSMDTCDSKYSLAAYLGKIKQEKGALYKGIKKDLAVI